MDHYWIRNPIPEHRRNRIIAWLPSELARFRREDDYIYFVSLLDDIALVDPSRTGKFSQWILKQLISNRLTAPDDYQKLNETLALFLKIAGRLPVEYRNINFYQNYSELFRAVEEFLPKTRSRQELREIGTNLLFEDDEYRLYELTTPEAAVSVSKNTGWCTCNFDTAREYLAKDHLYIIYEFNGGWNKYLLIHPSTKEVMHTDNSEYEENEPHLIDIIATFIPQVYCREHQSFRNKKCFSCEARECCGFIKCSYPNCSEYMCSDAECGQQCKTCEVYFCSDHIYEDCSECGEALCKGCYEDCPNCRQPMCADHQSTCEKCDAIFCLECLDMCYECNNRYCKGCGFECSGCQEEKCQECSKTSGSDDPICRSCDESFCEDCLTKCNSCDKQVCDYCVDEDEICPECQDMM